MVDETNIRTGQCHCGAVRFDASLSDGFNTIRRCTCSYCRMRGAVVVSAEMGGIRFLQGEDVLTSYRFNTGSARHFSALVAEYTLTINADPIRTSMA